MLQRHPSRFVVGLAGMVAVSLATAAAWAQTGGTTGTATAFTKDDFFIGVQDVQGANLSDFNANRFFNKARCDCDEDVFVFVTLKPSGFVKRAAAVKTGALEVWVGTSCDNATLRPSLCHALATPTWGEFLNVGSKTIPTTARIISTYTNSGVATTSDGGTVTSTSATFPETGTPTCTTPDTIDSFPQTIWVLVSTSMVGTYDVVVTRQVNVRLKPPPAPDSNAITVTGGEQALTVSWPKIDTSLFQNIQGYQILCNRAGSLKVFADGTFAAGFKSARSICPMKPENMNATAGIENLDPFFACSPLLTASTSSYRVKILQDDITYGAAVVTVDTHGNASVPDVFYGTPVRTKSFYDAYRDGNTGNTGSPTPGGDTGGFCNLAPGNARPGWALIGIVLGAVVIVVARRRRLR